MAENPPMCNCLGCQAHQKITVWERIAWEQRERAEAAEARLAEVEAERVKFEGWYLSARGMAERDAARLAEVEAERDDAAEIRDAHLYGLQQWQARAEAAEARLGAVEALEDWPTENGSESPWVRGYNAALRNVRAAARGEGDRLDASLRYIAERDAELLRRLGEGPT